jgi:sec-independent protein translocase protein TatB
MDILGVGPLELILILVIALIVVGPERLPEIARGIGKTWRQINEMSRLVTAQWKEELSAAVEQEAGKSGLNQTLADPLKEVKADLERVLTAPVTTPIQTISNAQATIGRPVVGGRTAPTESQAAAAPGEAAASPPQPASPPEDSAIPENGGEQANAEPVTAITDPATPPATDGTAPDHGNL